MCVQSLAEIKEANQEKMLPKEHPLHRAVERMIAYLDYMAHKLYRWVRAHIRVEYCVFASTHEYCLSVCT